MATHHSIVKYKILTVLALTIFLSSNSIAKNKPDTVKVGSYLMSLHDVNFHDKEYTMRFWLWFLYNNPDFDFTTQVEIPNAKSFEKPDVIVDTIQGKTWVLMKLIAVMKQSWNVQDYPFDEQKLVLSIENTMYDKRYLVYNPDIQGSTFAPTMNVDGWKIKEFKVFRDTNVYNTKFGDPRLSKQETQYDSFNIEMVLTRDAIGLFMKIFLGMYIAFFIGTLSFLIDVQEVEPRFGLPVGGLFAAVGNKYIIDSLLPETSDFTLVDTLHTIAFLFIFLTIFVNAWSLKYYDNGEVKKAKNINAIGSRIVLGSFTVLNIFFVGMAVFF
ncbi:MAG: hypothetical protein MUE33_10475 [Cytophagaceae bacterium]|jgi:hypothetical protein|nr:hypothetical protein [Cytophagaceae bacterium]